MLIVSALSFEIEEVDLYRERRYGIDLSVVLC